MVKENLQGGGGKPERGRFSRGIYIYSQKALIYIYFLGNSSFWRELLNQKRFFAGKSLKTS